MKPTHNEDQPITYPCGYAKRGVRVRIRDAFRAFRCWLLEDQGNRGLGGMPNNWRDTGYIMEDEGKTWAHELYARFGNDAAEIWIGHRWTENGESKEAWDFHCSTSSFRKIALWYLWRWAWGEWFGLRRWLYYKWLHRHCRQFRLAPRGEQKLCDD